MTWKIYPPALGLSDSRILIISIFITTFLNSRPKEIRHKDSKLNLDITNEELGLDLGNIHVRSSHSRKKMSCKKSVSNNFANFTAKTLCFTPTTLLKETSTQMFSCEIWEIFKNTYFEEHLRTAAFIMLTNHTHYDINRWTKTIMKRSNLQQIHLPTWIICYM